MLSRSVIATSRGRTPWRRAGTRPDRRRRPRDPRARRRQTRRVRARLQILLVPDEKIHVREQRPHRRLRLRLRPERAPVVEIEADGRARLLRGLQRGGGRRAAPDRAPASRRSRGTTAPREHLGPGERVAGALAERRSGAVVDDGRRPLAGARFGEVDAETLASPATKSVRTPSRASAAIAASPIACRGTQVRYTLSSPKCARLTATLASAPPNVAERVGDCSSRSNPGGLRRSMISPSVTTRIMRAAARRARSPRSVRRVR